MRLIIVDMEAADGGRRSTRTRRALGDISNQSETTTSVQVTKIAPKRRVSVYYKYSYACVQMYV